MTNDRSIARFALLPTMALLALFTACGGGSPASSVGADATKPYLTGVQVGRLVDIYAYQRIDVSNADRRIRFNRRLELVAENVVVDPNIQTDVLFDAAGTEVATATFELLPFDKEVGHEELLILWDNRDGDEKSRFDAAFAACQTGLLELAPAYRGQNTSLRPIPVIPRNAAFRLQFSGDVGVDDRFFALNPSAVQLLEFKGDPNVVNPVEAFRILPYRVISKGDRVILDTTILGGEGSTTTAGLPQSTDNVTANIRIAIPTRGSVVSTFYVKEDAIAELNDVDSSGRAAVIRDFRSGNELDGSGGRLRDSETPMIVGSMSMGITAVDAVNNIITLDKRDSLVPVRARYPFVDGPIDTSDLPLGPLAVPTKSRLRTGDILTQELLVDMPDGSIEQVHLRAEVLQNLSVGAVVGGTLPIGKVGNAQGGSEQGERLDAVQVRVATLECGQDSIGRRYSFEADPSGQDCVLRAYYYENVEFSSGTGAVTDADWRHLFLRIEPQLPSGTPAGTGLSPISSVAIEFTKPLDLEHIDNTVNLLLTNTSIATESFSEQLGDPKRATARVVPSRLSDIGGDGTLLRLQPPMGFFHKNGSAETYAFHVKLGTSGVLDFGGNPISLFDDPTNPEASWSVDLSIDPTDPDNLVGWHSYLFNDADEDGSLPGSIDMFGQFRLQNGRLIGAAGVRFTRTADAQNLGPLTRTLRGECWDENFDPTLASPPLPPLSPLGSTAAGNVPTDAVGTPHPGLLYWVPLFYSQVAPPNVPQVYEYSNILPQDVGKVLEPLNPRGSRLQMRFIEDDFTLDYHQPAEMGIDVDQLYWSPFNDGTVYYDVFDRFTMSLSHSNKRPDEYFEVVPGDLTDPQNPVLPVCDYLCAGNNSALYTNFAANVLQGTAQVPVFEDRVYEINPNEAFRAASGVKYIPYPRFERSYTWRDSRLVTVDATGTVIGLGGVQDPADDPYFPQSGRDATARISSPWIADGMPEAFINAGFSQWVRDEADFKGCTYHDHDPIALPLLVDFMMFPDDTANGLASGLNTFQVATLGPPPVVGPAPSGYYNTLGATNCSGVPGWPFTRVHYSGGEDQMILGAEYLVDPSNISSAQASTIKDAGLGDPVRALFSAPAGDGMLHWTQADFVRKVSTQVFGFFDTLQPQRAQFVNDPTGTPTVVATPGFPDLAVINGGNLRISEIVTQLDPPQARQPAGTSVVLEIRGANDFDNSGDLYNPTYTLTGQATPNDVFNERGNLLNANYACEAYRYSQATWSEGIFTARDQPRVAASGLTPYVTEDQIATLRSPTSGLLPRFLNLRLVMTNNVDVTPSLSPSLRSMSVVYRMAAQQ